MRFFALFSSLLTKLMLRMYFKVTVPLTSSFLWFLWWPLQFVGFLFPSTHHVYSQGNYTLISLHLNVPQWKPQRNSWHGLSCENKMHKFSKWFIHNLINIESQKRFNEQNRATLQNTRPLSIRIGYIVMEFETNMQIIARVFCNHSQNRSLIRARRQLGGVLSLLLFFFLNRRRLLRNTSYYRTRKWEVQAWILPTQVLECATPLQSFSFIFWRSCNSCLRCTRQVWYSLQSSSSSHSPSLSFWTPWS